MRWDATAFFCSVPHTMVRVKKLGVISELFKAERVAGCHIIQ